MCPLLTPIMLVLILTLMLLLSTRVKGIGSSSPMLRLDNV
jgi:hypothetical protein